ncbi:MAG: permease-like cell division protein FtsX [Candidatus Aminicenantes bacterium]|nr:permease-like cell division protein FtsX [Candidatus Aminicenantes bacterium]
MRFVIYSIKQAMANLLRNKVVNLLCLGIIAFTLLVPGIFNYISFNLERYIDKLSENVEAIIYIQDDSDNGAIEKLMQRMQANLLVKEVGFTSRDQAKANFSREFPELKYILSEFNYSPFPASIDVKFQSDARNLIQVESFVRDIKNAANVESVQLNMDWARKIAMIKKFTTFAGLFLSAILLIVSIFIIFNVVKINIFYRRDEINILRLVGASDWYIKTPFLIEGFVLGFLGGLLAGGLLLATIKAFPLYAGFVFNIIKQLIDFRQLPQKIFWQLLVTGTAIGLFSSFISLRRFIKQTPG